MPARGPRSQEGTVSARSVATWQSTVAEPCYACSTEWLARWIASLRSQRLRFVSARSVATWQSTVAEPCYACSTEWLARWIASLRSQRLRFVSARSVARWQSTVAEPCYACSIEWFARWIASLRSQIRQNVTQQTPHQCFQQTALARSRDSARRHWLEIGAVRTREPAR